VNFEDWQRTVPEIIRKDALWNMIVYRKALFLSDLGWSDVSKLAKDTRTSPISVNTRSEKSAWKTNYIKQMKVRITSKRTFMANNPLRITPYGIRYV
jgi:hypothetical protein